MQPHAKISPSTRKPRESKSGGSNRGPRRLRRRSSDQAKVNSLLLSHACTMIFSESPSHMLEKYYLITVKGHKTRPFPDHAS